MADWSLLDREWPPDLSVDNYQYSSTAFYPKPTATMSGYRPSPQAQFLPLAMPMPPPPPPAPLPPALPHLTSPPHYLPTIPYAPMITDYSAVPKQDNPREIRNKAEKQRRDKLNHSIAELASLVPPVVAANRKIDKTGILRLTAHYLRAHQYVFGDSISRCPREFSMESARALLGLIKGFVLTTTYRGLVVVVSQNVHQHLGYSELDLLGQNIFDITHAEDRQTLRDNLMPKSQLLGLNGELLAPEGPNGPARAAESLARERRRFVVRFRRHKARSEAVKYVRCVVEGSLRKSDHACLRGRVCPVRRARARADNPCASGNDVVFIGVVRPVAETFMSESNLEAFRMEYRTRHSIDGEIMECERRIALVTGYMTHEVNGLNAMNFMHRDDVRWVAIALRDMYDSQRLVGESCYRLMTKNGEFVYMRTRGHLDVDQGTRAVRSFVCTNTVVPEAEGKHLISEMKKKFRLRVNNDQSPPDEEKVIENGENTSVEDPRTVEEVILNLVTNLNSPQQNPSNTSPVFGETPLPLSIIPPERERIISTIGKVYDFLKISKPQEKLEEEDDNMAPAANKKPKQQTKSQLKNTSRTSTRRSTRTSSRASSSTVDPKPGTSGNNTESQMQTCEIDDTPNEPLPTAPQQSQKPESRCLERIKSRLSSQQEQSGGSKTGDTPSTLLSRPSPLFFCKDGTNQFAEDDDVYSPDLIPVSTSAEQLNEHDIQEDPYRFQLSPPALSANYISRGSKLRRCTSTYTPTSATISSTSIAGGGITMMPLVLPSFDSVHQAAEPAAFMQPVSAQVSFSFGFNHESLPEFVPGTFMAEPPLVPIRNGSNISAYGNSIIGEEDYTTNKPLRDSGDNFQAYGPVNDDINPENQNDNIAEQDIEGIDINIGLENVGRNFANDGYDNNFGNEGFVRTNRFQNTTGNNDGSDAFENIGQRPMNFDDDQSAGNNENNPDQNIENAVQDSSNADPIEENATNYQNELAAAYLLLSPSVIQLIDERARAVPAQELTELKEELGDL